MLSNYFLLSSAMKLGPSLVVPAPCFNQRIDWPLGPSERQIISQCLLSSKCHYFFSLTITHPIDDPPYSEELNASSRTVRSVFNLTSDLYSSPLNKLSEWATAGYFLFFFFVIITSINL